MKRIVSLGAVVVAAGLALSGCAAASGGGGGDAYPTKPVTIVVPYAAGGGSDATARQLAAGMEENLDGTVLVENRAGAAGAVGADSVSKAQADGYTLLSTNSFALIAGQELRDTQYSIEDFEAIAELTNYGLVQVVAADSSWETLDDLLAEDKVTYSHPGVGGMLQVTQSALFDAAGVKNAQGVPFDGGAPALTALLGGQVDTTASELSTALPYIESGDLRVLSTTTEERVEELPDVPTVAEAGYPEASLTASEVLLAPQGLPDAVKTKLLDAAKAATASADFTSFLSNAVTQPGTRFGSDLDQLLAEDVEQVSALLTKLDIQVTN